MADQSRCPVCNALVDASDTVCARCGFKLVGRTESFANVTAQFEAIPEAAQEKPVSKPVDGVPTLTIIKGPLQGEKFHLTDFPLVIGRDPECDLFLNNMTVTRKHALLEAIDGEVVITDLNSLNGTWIDGQIKDRSILKNGTIVQIGTFAMIFNI
ncbi:MAG: FHA domain-containing protein [bacterium]|nr:FHA domain-containing protein [bacterium]